MIQSADIFMNLDHEKLLQIFGSYPQFEIATAVNHTSFKNNKLIQENIEGSVFTFKNGSKILYKICTSKFSRTSDLLTIKGDGFLNGPWDIKAKQLANLFFKEAKSGSIIYVNNERRYLAKNRDGSVELSLPITVLMCAKNDPKWLAEKKWHRDIVEQIIRIYASLFRP